MAAAIPSGSPMRCRRMPRRRVGQWWFSLSAGPRLRQSASGPDVVPPMSLLFLRGRSRYAPSSMCSVQRDVKPLWDPSRVASPRSAA